MNSLCCISHSLAARFIGTYTMSLSVLMINVLMTNYFSRETDDDFFDTVEDWALLGLNWIQFIQNLHVNKRAQTAVLLFFLYTVLFLLASVYLVIGSISRKPKCAVLWMYLQMISIIDQSVALVVQLTQGQQYDVYERSIWYIPLSSIYLLACVYLWMVVHAARREWVGDQQSSEDFDMATTVSPFQPGYTGEPKTPSFLSQNFSMFDSPSPATILPK